LAPSSARRGASRAPGSARRCAPSSSRVGALSASEIEPRSTPRAAVDSRSSAKKSPPARAPGERAPIFLDAEKPYPHPPRSSLTPSSSPSPPPVRARSSQGDLKKEIKKLQRFRDQVKTWAGSNDVKDKAPLLEARKKIEIEMERFREVEKETKTKAFSKEGLMAARNAKDPREKAKDDAREWLGNAVESLNSQIESFENEIEAITSVKSKGKSKNSPPPRLGHLEESMSRHHQHIARLELCLKLIDDDALEPTDAEDLKDLVEDYVERNQDDFDEFADPEELYADMNLDELEENKAAIAEKRGGSLVDKATSEKTTPAASDTASSDAAAPAMPGASSAAPAPKKTPEKAIPAPMGGAKLGGIPAPLGLKTDGANAEPPSGKVLPGPKGREGSLGGNGGSWGAPGGAGGSPAAAAAANAGGLQQQQSWSFPPGGGSPGQEPPNAYAAQNGAGAQGSSKFPLPMQAQQRLAREREQGGANANAQGAATGSPAGSPLANQRNGSPGGKGLPAPLQFPKQQQPPSSGADAGRGVGGGPQGNLGTQGNPGPLGANATNQVRTAGDDADPFAIPGPLADFARVGFRSTDGASPKASPASSGSGGDLASSPSGSPGGGLDLASDPAACLRLLESSYRNLPQPEDGRWSRRRSDAPDAAAPASYPSSQVPVLRNPALFERLDADALFFTFYYQQGTAQQYLAARELKRANWRFHKKHATWFARQEEPKASTEAYEQGSYIYFDFAMSGGENGQAPGGWCQRSKADFKFEYSQLESEMN
jgi:CCR4-NOT transcription complex subunit 3